MDTLRKLYPRTVQIPLDNVAALWQELQAFENNLNRSTAKMFMSDLASTHRQTHTVRHKLVAHAIALYPPSLVLPCHLAFHSSVSCVSNISPLDRAEWLFDAFGNDSGTTTDTQSANVPSSSLEHSDKPETTELTKRKAE